MRANRILAWASPVLLIIFAIGLAGCASAPQKSVAIRPASTPPATLPPALNATDAPSMRREIRRAFGSMLVSVSVEATRLTGIIDDGGNEHEAFRVEYRLLDCQTPVITFLNGFDDTGVVPPLTQFDDRPAGGDRMNPQRFRELLRAYGRVSDSPFGELVSYATALSRVVDDPKHDLRDMWVITSGVGTQAELKRLRHTLYPGYVFSFPVGGTPKFVEIVPELGWGPDFTD